MDEENNTVVNNEVTSTDIVYGLSYMVLSLLFLLLYIPVVMGFSKLDSTSDSITYRLMIVHSISDILQLICHFITGISLMLPIHTEWYIYWFIGALLTASWLQMLTLTLTLTIHRFLLIVFDGLSRLLLRPFFIWTVALFNLSVWWFVFGVNLTAYSNMFYSFDEHDWFYNKTKVVGQILAGLDYDIMFGVCVVTLPLYLVIFAYIYCKKKSLHRNELCGALQMFSYCLFTLFVCVLWMWGDLFIPEDSHILWLFVDMLWPLWNGANAVLYLVFNRTLQSSLRTIKVRVRKSITHNKNRKPYSHE